MTWFELLPIIVFGPGVLACIIFLVGLVRSNRRLDRIEQRCEQLARNEHQRAILGPNVIPIWTAPSLQHGRRERSE